MIDIKVDLIHPTAFVWRVLLDPWVWLLHPCIHAPICIHIINNKKIFKELKRFICKFSDMERQRRNTKKYSFRQPDLKELRNLTSYVLDPLGFKARFGKLLPLLTTQVDEGLMSVLVQFYDPLYRCFTFPDFRLLPTLEEYAYLVGIPVLDQLPFSGLERVFLLLKR